MLKAVTMQVDVSGQRLGHSCRLWLDTLVPWGAIKHGCTSLKGPDRGVSQLRHMTSDALLFDWSRQRQDRQLPLRPRLVVISLQKHNFQDFDWEFIKTRTKAKMCAAKDYSCFLNCFCIHHKLPHWFWRHLSHIQNYCCKVNCTAQSETSFLCVKYSIQRFSNVRSTCVFSQNKRSLLTTFRVSSSSSFGPVLSFKKFFTCTAL